MISTKGLTENLLPNVYLKNVTLQTVSDIGKSNVTVSVKFIEKFESKLEITQLLESELKKYLNFYIYQYTDQQEYNSKLMDLSETTPAESLLTPPEAIAGVPTSLISGEGTTLLWGPVTIFTGFEQNIQLLSDGRLIEGVDEQVFTFDKDTNFLGYILFAVINHPDLSEVILGKVTSDIVILDGQLQNEGLVFTIAGSKTAEYGNTGDIWAGPVHMHHGKFMVGSAHSEDKTHPYLDYQIVPVTKFVDNRVKEKIEKNILNITETYEKLNSLTTKYTSNSLNLLDFETYKSVSYISDIYLSQDSKSNINGVVSVDQHSLLKSKSAFRFMFDNIKQAFTAPDAAKLLNMIFSAAKLMRLNIYENDALLGTIDQKSDIVTNFLKNAKVSLGTPFKPSFSITKEEIKLFGDNVGIQHFSFKRNYVDIGKFKYRVEVEYYDPTVDLIKEIKTSISNALISINFVMVYAERVKGFNSHTKALTPSVLDYFTSFSPFDLIDEDGQIGQVYKLVTNELFKAYIYNPNIKDYDGEVVNYFKSLSNIKTTTLDHLLTLQKFLIDLRAKIEDHLVSFGSKSSKLAAATATQNAYTAQKAHVTSTPRIIKEATESSITLNNHGYNFIGRIPASSDAVGNKITTITALDYKSAILDSLSQLMSGPPVEPALAQPYTPKGLPEENLTKDGYSFLNIPVDPDNLQLLKKSVKLPTAVLDINQQDVREDNIFNAIVEFKNMLSGDNSNKLSFDEHKYRTAFQLNAILEDVFGTFIGSGATYTDSTTAALADAAPGPDPVSNPPLFNNNTTDNPMPGPGWLTKEQSKPNKFNFNFIKTALLSKSLLAGGSSFMPNMSKPGFKPLSDQEYDTFEQYGKLPTLSAPPQVKALSIKDDQIGPFKDFLGSDQFYIKNGVVNPLYLCYFWFIHQNIVKVEYLDSYTDVLDVIITKNADNPYVSGKGVFSSQRNIKKPFWKKVDINILSDLGSEEKILCRLVKYEDTKYINNVLSDALNLPLMNNYFMLEGS